MLNGDEDFFGQQSTSAFQESQLSNSVSSTNVNNTSLHLLESITYFQTSTERRSESSNSNTEESNWHASGTVSVEAEASANIGFASGSVKTSASEASVNFDIDTSSFSDEVAEIVDFSSKTASIALQTIKDIAIMVEKQEDLRAIQEQYMVRAI